MLTVRSPAPASFLLVEPLPSPKGEERRRFPLTRIGSASLEHVLSPKGSVCHAFLSLGVDGQQILLNVQFAVEPLIRSSGRPVASLNKEHNRDGKLELFPWVRAMSSNEL